MDTMFLEQEFLRKLEYLAYISKRIRKGAIRGEHFTYRKGSSLEFRDHRSYHAGDDFRYIDWNVYSRLKKIFVKLFRAEEDLTVHLFVDISASMAQPYPEKLEYAKKLAAALGYVAISNLDRAGMISFNAGIGSVLPPIRRKNQGIGMFQFLSSLESTGSTNINSVLKEYSFTNKRPGLAIVISDFLDPSGYEQGIFSLLFNKYDVVMLQVLAEEEIAPTRTGQLKMTDAESENATILTVDKYVLDLYRKELRNYLSELEDFSLKHGVEYMRTSTSIPFDEVVLKYLRQGMHLH